MAKSPPVETKTFPLCCNGTYTRIAKEYKTTHPLHVVINSFHRWDKLLITMNGQANANYSDGNLSSDFGSKRTNLLSG